jgi:beta-lactam-binding protein with PASTA domain
VVLPGGGSVAPGQVIATSPPANERVAPGSSVLLIVRKN